MSTRKQLFERWTVEPWRSVDRQIVEFCRQQAMAASPWASPDSEALFALLDGLPSSEEVPSGRDLRASSFPGGANMDLREADFTHCREIVALDNCDLTEARLDHARGEITRVAGTIVRASFRDARLQRAWLTHSTFSSCDFREARLKSAMLQESDFRGSLFDGADCRGADFQQSDLRGCSFAGANLSGAMLRAVLLDETTDLRGANLVDAVFDPLVDNAGRLVLQGTDWRIARHDDTTVTGTEPASVDREILGYVIHEASGVGEPWATRLVDKAERARRRLDEDPSYRWYDVLLEQTPATDLPQVEELVRRASLLV